MSALSFHSPYLLAGAALLVGLWAAWYLPKLFGSRGDGRSAFRFPSVSPFKEIGGGQAVLPFKLLKAARLAVLILLAIALGRPQSGKEHTKISTEGIDIILAVDTSGSMEALDLDTDQPLAQRRNRLEIVKDVVQDFVEARPNDQMGLVVFGSEAYTQCPMTLDHGILSGFLDRLEIGMAGDGTALGNAIGRAVKRLKDSDAKSKVVVLLTDGRSNAGKLSPLKAAEVAQSLGIKILHCRRWRTWTGPLPPSGPLRNAAGIPGRRYRRRDTHPDRQAHERFLFPCRGRRRPTRRL